MAELLYTSNLIQSFLALAVFYVGVEFVIQIGYQVLAIVADLLGLIVFYSDSCLNFLLNNIAGFFPTFSTFL